MLSWLLETTKQKPHEAENIIVCLHVKEKKEKENN